MRLGAGADGDEPPPHGRQHGRPLRPAHHRAVGGQGRRHARRAWRTHAAPRAPGAGQAQDGVLRRRDGEEKMETEAWSD